MTEDKEIGSTGPLFTELAIAPKLQAAISCLGFTKPTPIQLKAIPLALEGHDLIGIAQTGTGKTLAFGLPMVQRIAQLKARALVVAPTRELAQQIEEMLMCFGKSIGLRTAVLIGGAAIGPQKKALFANPHVIVGTPGRIIDHLEQRTLDLTKVKVLVLDEADRMLDMGFLPQIKRILQSVPSDRQTLLFSATMPEAVTRIAERWMKNPQRIEVAPAGTPAELVEHQLYVVRPDQKLRLLRWLLDQYKGTALVFTRTRYAAKRVCGVVRDMGHTAAEIHSDRSQIQRKEALDGFKSGKYRILVATDIAARGIDVFGIELVINYDTPENPEDYIHRIGRTGRAGQKGKAITMAMPDQGGEVRDIEHLAGIYLPVNNVPDALPDLPPRRHAEHDSDGGSGRRFGHDRDRGHSSGGHRPDAGGYTFYEGEPSRPSHRPGGNRARRPFGGRPSGGRPTFGRSGGARRRR
ncbi:MAG: DEAD/DEAH box helicase [Patescibacteria group bacterium]|jgi:ATP-dependent RNA helicase RhlE